MTFKTIALAAAMMLGSALPAAAQSLCSEPIAPAAIDGNTATKEQIVSILADVKTFIKQSDDYQGCLLKELADARLKAVKDKKDLDPTLEPAVTAKVQANQSLKEKVGKEFNDAAIAYNAKHPK
ncbi:MAG TPA: hypothetical protein VGC36_07245 [Rhizomicrobium sp.]